MIIFYGTLSYYFVKHVLHYPVSFSILLKFIFMWARQYLIFLLLEAHNTTD